MSIEEILDLAAKADRYVAQRNEIREQAKQALEAELLSLLPKKETILPHMSDVGFSRINSKNHTIDQMEQSIKDMFRGDK